MKAMIRERRCRTLEARTPGAVAVGADAEACAWASPEWEEVPTGEDGEAEAETKATKTASKCKK
jgi:hypothetical protein